MSRSAKRTVQGKAPTVMLPSEGSGLPQVGIPSGVFFVPGASAMASLGPSVVVVHVPPVKAPPSGGEQSR